MANYKPKIEYSPPGGGPTVSIVLTLAPEGDPVGESTKVNANQVISGSGVRQVNRHFKEKISRVKLTFLSKTQKEDLELMFDEQGSAGRPINYFVHEDEVEFDVYEVVNKELFFRRLIPDAAGDFLYSVDFVFRRVKV